MTDKPWYIDLGQHGLQKVLGIEIVEMTPDRVVATMPVNDCTHQPFGILHGGASIALAETVASLGAANRIDREKFVAVGQEINGNHLRPKSDGVVTATGVPVHVGRSLAGVVDRDSRRGRQARVHLPMHDGDRCSPRCAGRKNSNCLTRIMRIF